MNNRDMALKISSILQLENQPVALSFVESIPTTIPAFDQEVPSACTFWRKAESSVFFAPAEKHYNCPIGVLTMGFDMPESVQKELVGFVHKMVSSEYLAIEEAEKIPTSKKKKAGIVYGPLKEFPLEPDLILLWLTPSQAMLYSEAAGTGRWTEASPTAVFGRPACAALPVALENSQMTLSLGCMGMRTFTEISADRLLGVIPGNRAQDFCDALESTLEANDEMQIFYETHKAQFIG